MFKTFGSLRGAQIVSVLISEPYRLYHLWAQMFIVIDETFITWRVAVNSTSNIFLWKIFVAFIMGRNSFLAEDDLGGRAEIITLHSNSSDILLLHMRIFWL